VKVTLRVLVFSIALMFPLIAQAYATPVYLSCQLRNSDGAFRVNITLDEATRQVTLTYPTGSPDETKGVFYPDRVTFATRLPEPMPIEFRFTINRVDLSIQREHRNAIEHRNTIENGTCSVEKAAANRKF
jgi:hypothetical protein